MTRYEFDSVIMECVSCYNLVDAIVMWTQDDNGKDKTEYHLCPVCKAAVSVGKVTPMTLEELDAYIKNENEREEKEWMENNK